MPIHNESRFKRYLELPFGEKEPHEIAPLDVDRIRVMMLKSKSPQTVKNTLELFRRIINFGVKMQLCQRLSFPIEFPKPDNHKTEDLTPEEMERARRQFGLLEQMVEKIESFARTAKYLQQTDFLLFGINTDDTRDSVTDERVENIKDNSKFEQAKADLEEQYIEMQKQVSWIQSGGFESETLEEMERKMRQEEAEDAEFYNVDEDE